jgi:tRNA nucleotidyltransferase/poly(A) polymerase
VIDYVDGQADLSAGLVRAIGNADERISEDKLRMLRAVRFAAAFGFAIESATLAAVQRMAGEISQVSAERIGMELRRMLVDPARTRAVSLLAETGLLAVVLPDVAELDASRMLQIGRRLAALEDPTLATVLAVLHHPTRNQPSESAELVRQVGRRLRLTNQEIDRAAWLLDTLPIAIDAKNAPWPRLQRVLVHTGAEELIALLEAIAGPDDPALAYCRERLALPAAELNPAPLVDGADLISHGLEPGPEFGTLLDRVRDAQLVEQIATRDEALALVDHLLASGQDE